MSGPDTAPMVEHADWCMTARWLLRDGEDRPRIVAHYSNSPHCPACAPRRAEIAVLSRAARNGKPSNGNPVGGVWLPDEETLRRLCPKPVRLRLIRGGAA